MNTAIHLSTTQKMLLFLAAVSGIIWLGGSTVRAAIAFELFIPGTLTFKPAMSADAVLQTIRLFGITAFYTMVSYGLFAVLGGTLWLMLRRTWKVRGGLFIAGALIALYVPVEAIQMFYDLKLVLLVQDGSLTLDVGKELVLKRISVLSGAPLLAMLGYFTAVWFLILQPMKRGND